MRSSKKSTVDYSNLHPHLLKRAIKNLKDQERYICENSYYHFFQAAWLVMEENTKLVNNWHIPYLCGILQMESERIDRGEKKTKDYIINISPRTAKSYIVSIMLAPWTWTRFPYMKFINSSYSSDLSIHHAVKSRRLLMSRWYQSHWAGRFRMTGDQNVKGFYENNKGGHRFATSVGKGDATGHGADIVISDDSMSPKKSRSETYRKEANDHCKKDLHTRLNNYDVGVRIYVSQRLHEDDTTGSLLKTDSENYHHICIPVEYDEEIVSPASLKRYYKEGLFFPERYSRDIVERLKTGEFANEFPGQFQQKPMPKDGGIFKPDNWEFYDSLPPRFDVCIQSWDASFLKTEDSSYVVGQVWGKIGTDYYLVDQFRQRAGFMDTIKAIAVMSLNHTRSDPKLVENKANGPAILDTLSKHIEGLRPVDPDGSKEARARAINYLQVGGNVYLPNPKIKPWVNDYIAEHALFPNSKNNDQVDATSQALYWLSGGIDVFERLNNLLIF